MIPTAGLHQSQYGARTQGRGASPRHGRLGEAPLPNVDLVASLMQPCSLAGAKRFRLAPSEVPPIRAVEPVVLDIPDGDAGR